MTACPKCGTELAEGVEACPTCGLATANHEQFAIDDQEEAPPELAPLWEACRAEWGSEEAHDRFLEEAARLDAFVQAGRSYRRAARERGADDPQVVSGLERVRRMAEAAWLTRAPEVALASESQDRGPYRTVALLFITLVLLAGLGGITVYIIRTLRPDDPASGQVRPTPTRHSPDGVGN